MPNYDGAGPRGLGQMTGRGLGPCGRGRSGFGRGLGRCYLPRSLSKDEEKKLLEQELEEINKRLKELKD